MDNNDFQKEQDVIEEHDTELEENDVEEDSDDLENETFTYSVNNSSNNQIYDDKKSFLYIAVGVVILLLIIIVLVIAVNKSKKSSFKYSDVESKMVSAAKKYYEKNNDLLPTIDGSSISISADTLIQNSFLKPFSEMVEEDASCSGNVEVFKSGDDYAYFPFLDCGEKYVSLKLSNDLVKVVNCFNL